MTEHALTKYLILLSMRLIYAYADTLYEETEFKNMHFNSKAEQSLKTFIYALRINFELGVCVQYKLVIFKCTLMRVK